jgi:hypothetical protein
VPAVAIPLAKSIAGVVPPELVILPLVPATDVTGAVPELIEVILPYVSTVTFELVYEPGVAMPLTKSNAGVVPPELDILPAVPDTELTFAAIELVTVVEKLASLPNAVANSTKVFSAAGAAPITLFTAVEAAVSA